MNTSNRFANWCASNFWTVPAMRILSILSSLSLVALLLMATGCSSVKPWVKPYERVYVDRLQLGKTLGETLRA